ncbi:MAG: hypothetical protein K2Q18_06765, partial [Bdellovibrionales bacterium]|nr:hypothetical protein [Bdellovibrionales bacterium]
SKEASLKVSKILTEKAGAKLSFSGVNFSLIPLSTTFKNVKISKHDPALLDVDIEASDLEVAFTYSSFIASEPEIDEISLRGGKVDLKIYKKNDSDIDIRKIKTKEIFTKYNEILKKVPVRLNLIMLEDIQLNIDDVSMHVNQASLFPQKVSMRVKADVSDLKINQEGEYFSPLQISNIQLLGIAEKDEWKIENFKLTKDKNTVELKGVALNEGPFLNFNSSGNLNVNAEDILGLIKKLPKEVASIKGNVEGKFTTAGIINNPDVSIDFIGRNVDTEWAQAEVAKGVVSKKKNLLWLDSFSAAKGKESYQLKKPQAFFDLKMGKFTNFNFSIRLQNAYSNTFLHTIRSTLDVLKGNFTGDIEAALFEDRAVFTIKDRVQVTNFKLTTSDGKKDILSNSGFGLENSVVIINQDFSVNVDLKATMPNSKIQAKGKITDKRIDIVTTDSKIDMQYFGPISGIKISGAGPAEVKVSGPMDNVVFNFKVDWNNFSLLDLNFGKVKSEFSLNLQTLLLEIQSLEGQFNKTNFTASGSLGFEGEGEGMNLTANFKNATFSDTKKMLNLVFKKIKLPVDPEFNFDGDFSIQGGYDVEKLKVDGVIRGSDLKVAGEDAEKISLKLSLASNLLALRQIKINKSRGEISANLSVNLANNYIELTGGTQSFRLRDFNFYRNLSLEYDGDVFLDFDGNGTVDDFSSRFKTRVANAFIGNIPASSSNAIFYVNSNDIVTNASLLAGKIKVDSLMSFKTGIAAIKSSIDTADMKEFLGIFSSHNINDKGISGRIKAQLNTQISMGSLGVRKFFLNIDQLILRRGDINMIIDPRYNSIEVDDGTVKKWDLRLRDGNEFIISKGRNISNGVIALDHRFSLKASLLELVASQIERATGTIRGADEVILDKKINIKDFSLYGNDHSLKIRGLPGYITNLDYSV